MLTDFSGYLILVVAVVLTLALLICGATLDFCRACSPSSTTPATPAAAYVPARRSSALIAFLVGLLYPLYTITGFDASAHTSEETFDARGRCRAA